MLLRLSFSFCLLMALGACSIKNDYQKMTGTTRGTTFAITFRGTTDDFSKVQADSLFGVIEHSMSLWDSTSLLSQFNKAEKSQAIDEHFYNVLQKSFEIHQQSDGAFDPTVGALINAYSFSNKNQPPLPSQQTLDSLTQLVGLQKISFNDNQVEKEMPLVQLDLNAIAQGYTVDVIASFLENKGIEHYLVEVGGEVRAKGQSSKEEPWEIGIKRPTLNEANSLQTVVGLENASLSTSGNYRNFSEIVRKRIKPIIDPTTSKPVTHSTVSVTVIAPTCTEADAWATAFTVLGKEKSLEIAKKFDFDLQIVSFEKGLFTITQTDGFKKIIH